METTTKEIHPENIENGVKKEVRKMVDHIHVDSVKYLLNRRTSSSEPQADENKKKAKKKPIIVRQTLFVLTGKCLFVVLLAGLAQALIYFLFSSVSTPDPQDVELIDQGGLDLSPLLSIATFFVQSTQAIILLYFFSRWFTTRYILTPEDVITESGIFHKHRDIYATSNVESIKLEQSLIQRIGSFGTICMYAPTLRKSIYLYDIPRPFKIQKKLDTFIHPPSREKSDPLFRVFSNGSIIPGVQNN